MFEANVRAIIAFREIGRGFQAIEKFSECMNMYCITETPFTTLNNSHIYKAYNETASASMKRAADELQDDTVNGPIKKRAKLDGAWSKRGHSSLNGVVTLIVDDKCLDIQAYSKHCKGCKMWEKQKGTLAYQRWKCDHNCHANHTKSSGAMEYWCR